MQVLRGKLVTYWSNDDMCFVIGMYKKASFYKYSIDAELEAIKTQDKKTKLRERLKSEDSIMNPLRTTKS